MIECKNVSLTIDKADIFKNLSLNVPNGGITCLLGRNGSGKSSLLSCILKQRRFEGNIEIDSDNINALNEREISRSVSFLPQILPSPCVSVRELVSFGRYPYTGMMHTLSHADRLKVDEAMSLTQTEEFSERNVTTLSGGEKQRVFFAMLLAQDTPNVILDEPTTYMDAGCELRFYSFLKLLRDSSRAVLVVMHDIAAALEQGDTFAFLNEGRLTCFQSADECIKEKAVETAFSLKPHKLELDGKTRFLLTPEK